MGRGTRAGAWAAGLIVAALAVAAGLRLTLPPGAAPPASDETWVAPPPQVAPTLAQRWRAAAKKVEEERGEPMGRAAGPDIPAPLRHYADTRRFLAIQVAGWMEQEYELPHDEAALARLIATGDLAEIEPVGDHHVLYGVGANASDGPFTHWDRRSGREVRLFPDWAAFDDARQAARAEIDAGKERIEAKLAELRRVPRRERRRRAALQREVASARAETRRQERDLAREASFYDHYDRRRTLVAEWQEIERQARAFPGRVYDLRSPGDRRALRARMLSFVRPPARDVMMEIAAAYHARFGRPLAYTSLFRTLHYQRQLGEVNANATTIDAPPHSTGLAFDIFYRYMTRAEQDFLMDLIAGMERAGRVEALRERRDHFHVFAFAGGRRPSERLVAAALDDVRPGRSAVRAAARAKPAGRRTASRAARKATPARASARTAKAAPRKTARRPPRRR